MATAKPMDNITECPICTEVYVDPRVLPCGHTFCLQCIESMSNDKGPGDQLACPLCRKEFILPSSGVSDLPKNFFVVNFLQARESTSVESKKTGPCETTVYCVECQKPISIEEKLSMEALLPETVSLNYCDEHVGDLLKIYLLRMEARAIHTLLH